MACVCACVTVDEHFILVPHQSDALATHTALVGHIVLIVHIEELVWKRTTRPTKVLNDFDHICCLSLRVCAIL